MMDDLCWTGKTIWYSLLVGQKFRVEGFVMDRDMLRQRTHDFAVRIVKLVAALPCNSIGFVLGKQLLKSGTSIGANYREAQRASSKRHFITTLEIAAREADETLYWLQLLSDSSILKPQRLAPLIRECNELVSILVAAIRTAKRRP